MPFSIRMTCHLELAKGALISIYCGHSVMPGAYPHMTYYLFTFDLRSRARLALEDLFIPDSGYNRKVAETRLQTWIENWKSDPESYQKRETKDMIQSTLDYKSDGFRDDYYGYYLESDCYIQNK